MALKYPQLQTFTLYSSGVSIGDTSMTLASFKSIDGVQLAMTDFGAKGFMTIEPGSGQQEEQISFSGVTLNSNGTTTISGIKNVMMLSPYTETSGFTKQHSGGSSAVVAVTSGLLAGFADVNNDESVGGIWTFDETKMPRISASHTYGAGEEEYLATKRYVDGVAVAGAPNASVTAKGIVQEATQAQIDARTATGSTGARLFPSPSLIRASRYSDTEASGGAGAAYTLTVVPAITAYAVGQEFTFIANHASTGASTLAVCGLAAMPIVKWCDEPLIADDIANCSVVKVVFDGVYMQMMNPISRPQVSQDGIEVYAAATNAGNNYSITLVPAPVTLIAGMKFRWKASATNTGATTLAVNGGTAKTVVLSPATSLAGGEIVLNSIIETTYDGTNFQMSVVPTSLIAGVSSDCKGYHSHGVVASASNVAASVDGVWVPTLTATIPAGVLSTKHGIRIKGFGTASCTQTGGAASTVAMRFIFGGTTFSLSAPCSAHTTGTSGVFNFEIDLFNIASAAVQKGTYFGSQVPTNSGSSALITPQALSTTVNTAVNVSISLDIQANTGGEAANITMSEAVLEYVFTP